MNRVIRAILGVSIAAMFGSSAWALEVNDRVENFRLYDHEKFE